MKKFIEIGQKVYPTKKAAIEHYKAILNTYTFGQSLNDDDYFDLIDLLEYSEFNNSVDNNALESSIPEQKKELTLFDEVDYEQNELFIADIKVSRVQFNTKCFEIIYNDHTSDIISYLLLINSTSYTPEKLFISACRNAIHDDINSIKKEYFEKFSVNGKAKCQETGVFSEWSELVVDHRQPNTFSIIIERFMEINVIDIISINYTKNSKNMIVFEDAVLAEKFKQYHKEKAVLRIVRRECNLSRTNLARVKRNTKDLKIK